MAMHSAPGTSNRWKWSIALVLTGAVALSAFQFSGSKPAADKDATGPVPQARTAKVTRGTLERRIRLAGSTAARDFANITAPMIRGPEGNRPMVLLRLAPSGSTVKPGDMLAEIDGQSLQDHIEDVKDTVAAAEADIRKRKAELEIDWKNLEQTLQVAKAELDKARLDASAGEVRTEVERQLLQLSFEEAQARYKQLQGDLDTTRKQHASDIRLLELTLERHRRHLNRHVNDIKRFRISSPIPGLAVYQNVWGGSSLRQIETGDNVTPGQSFMKVVNPASMMLESRVNQAESEDFRIGQEAVMRLDAFPGFTLKGKVFSIGALAVGGRRENYYIRTVPIRIAFEGADKRLIPDLSGSADVLLGRAENALLVPLGAVRRENGKAYVQVRTAQGFEKRAIETGLRNEVSLVVLNGLKEGEEVRLD